MSVTIINLYWQLDHKTPAIIFFRPGLFVFQPWLHAGLTAVRAGQLCQLNEAIYRSSAKPGLCAGLGHLWLTPLSCFLFLTEGEKRIFVMLNRRISPSTLKSDIHSSRHPLTQRHFAEILAGTRFGLCLSVMFGSSHHTPKATTTGVAGNWEMVGKWMGYCLKGSGRTFSLVLCGVESVMRGGSAVGVGVYG